MRKTADDGTIIYICICHRFTFSTFNDYAVHCKDVIQQVTDEVEKDKNQPTPEVTK